VKQKKEVSNFCEWTRSNPPEDELCYNWTAFCFYLMSVLISATYFVVYLVRHSDSIINDIATFNFMLNSPLMSFVALFHFFYVDDTENLKEVIFAMVVETVGAITIYTTIIVQFSVHFDIALSPLIYVDAFIFFIGHMAMVIKLSTIYSKTLTKDETKESSNTARP